MQRKPIVPFLKRQYKRLEKEEKKLRRGLASLYLAHALDVRAIIADAYDAARDGDKIRYANLMKRISTAEAMQLQRDGAKQGVVLAFDRLNKMQATEAKLLISELALADDEYYLISKHLARHAEDCWIELEEYLDYYGAAMTAAALAAILRDNNYPIQKTIKDNHRKLAKLTAQRISQSIVAGRSEKEAAKDVTDYVTRREKAHSDGVLYYEGTRTTTQTVYDVVGDVVSHFRSVTVKDNKACKRCREIEAEQERDPVPIRDFDPGVTAPPFHPYCRCSIEVMWDDDYQEDE